MLSERWELSDMRMLDLCAGIGGFSFAAEYMSGWDEYETVAFVEIDKDCQDVLRARCLKCQFTKI